MLSVAYALRRADRIALQAEAIRFLGAEPMLFDPNDEDDLDPEALAEAAEHSLAPLFQRPKMRKLLDMPKEEELGRLAEEAALLCLDLLEGE